MPGPVPTAGALRALKAQLHPGAFVCPSCTAPKRWDGFRPQRWRGPVRRQQQRAVSSVAPVTTVNATRVIPAANRELHHALSSLEHVAAAYVNLPQLRLALRGLEADNAVTRVAVLGLNDRSGGPRRLVRALLADPLVQEPAWEAHLGSADTDPRALLVKYGEDYDHNDQHPLLRIMSVPAATLNRRRIEVLICARRASTGDAVLQELLVPTLETPASGTGRMSTIAYPVHKAVVYGDGVQSIRTVPTIPVEQASCMARSAVNVEWQKPGDDLAVQGISLINLSEGELAISQFRQSPSNAFSYEHGWLDSKIADVLTFVLAGTAGEPGSPKPIHRAFIGSVLSDADATIESEESRYLALLPSTATDPAVLESLRKAIAAWAVSAHTELRDELANAFHGRAWRKLAWWKLPWRVDDIGMIGTEVLSRAYLVDAEKGVVWVGGRIDQAGLLAKDGKSAGAAEAPARTLMGPVPVPTVEDMVRMTARDDGDDGPPLYFDPKRPWPQQIAVSRAALLATTLPALQARAQSLLLQAASTASLASAVSALAYLSVSTTSPYEAGAVAAVGLAWSAKRLQRRWEGAKAAWVEEVREEGRRVLAAVEGKCRAAVEWGARRTADEAAVQERARAREGVGRARQALQGIK